MEIVGNWTSACRGQHFETYVYFIALGDCIIFFTLIKLVLVSIMQKSFLFIVYAIEENNVRIRMTIYSIS